MSSDINKLANCMTIAVGKSASKTGRVIIAHNEDDYVHAKVKHHYVPAADWPEGTLLPAEEGLSQIPQVNHTYAYSWVEIRGEKGGLSTSDCFLNENGVCIVSDSSCGSNEDVADSKLCSDGIVYELRRALAERSKSAKHALEIACELVEKYGYASPGRIYFLADKDEIYMLQLCRGKTYAAVRVPDDCTAVMPNHYTIHSLNDCVCHSKGIIERAIEKGFYKPEKGDYSDFDFAKAFQDPKTYLHPVNTLRQKYSAQMLLGKEWSVERDGFPPYVQIDKALSVEDLMNAMSTHYEGNIHDIRFGAGLTPHETAVRRVCTATTVESMIYELADEAKHTTVWTAFGRPCELMYVPLHPLYGYPKQLEAIADPFKAAEEHFAKAPQDTAYAEGIWQQMQDFQNKIEFVYSERIDAIKQMNRAMHDQLVMSENKLRQSGFEDYANADEIALNLAIERINEFEAETSNDDNVKITAAKISVCEGFSQAVVEYESNLEPDLSALLFGPGRSEISAFYAKPVIGSLKRIENNRWQISFLFEKQPLKEDGAGVYEFYLGGKAKNGKCFYGMTLLQLNQDGSAESLNAK